MLTSSVLWALSFSLILILFLSQAPIVNGVEAEVAVARIDVIQQRRAFYRGEVIPLRVSIANTSDVALKRVTLAVRFDDLSVASESIAAIGAGQVIERLIRISTGRYRSATYDLSISVEHDGQALNRWSEPVVLAARPRKDRMPVWLWPHRAYLDQVAPFDEHSRHTLDWWADHGFTNLVVSEHLTDRTSAAMDYALERGLNVCIMPNGGLREAGSSDLDPADDELWFNLGGGEFAMSLLTPDTRVANPFHPAVAAWQDAANERLMRAVAEYPHISTAFFNTEIDELRLNHNAQGLRLIEERLGFMPDEVGEPKWLMPGVIADDDRGYRLDKFTYTHGRGLSTANQRTAKMVHRYRPDIITINDPYRDHALLGGFPGVDAVGSWTYTNPDPKLALYVETLRAATRGTDQIPLSTITLLNYPGELTPTDAWTMMGPGRLAEITWINLSRAPRMLGYYFSSACDPFAALEDDLVTPKADVSEVALPPATYEMMQRLGEEVIQPLGPSIREMVVAPRRVAVLSSAMSGLYSKHPRLLGYYSNMQVYHFYTLLAMAHLPADIVFDEQVTRDGLGDYDVLVLPWCEVMPESVYREVLAFQQRGGLVIADQYLGAEIPDVMKFNFDFTYRDKVKALAIAEGRGYIGWNDHLKPGSAEIQEIKGVSALEDQRILESYAHTLREAIDGKVQRQIDCDSPTALINILESGGARSLVIVNDKRDYDDRVGEYRAVLGQLMPQTVTIRVNDWDWEQLFAYDTIRRQSLNVTKTAEGGFTFEVELDGLGGTMVGLYPRPIRKIELDVLDRFDRGESSAIAVRLVDDGGSPVAGIQPIELRIIDSNGNLNEGSGFYSLRDGMITNEFMPAINDVAGEWRLEATDLSAGLEAAVTIRVD